MACAIGWSSSEWCHSHHDILTKTKVLKETSGWMARMGLLKDSGMLLSSTWNFRSVDLMSLLSSKILVGCLTTKESQLELDSVPNQPIYEYTMNIIFWNL